MKTLRKKLWTHFPGSAPGPLTIMGVRPLEICYFFQCWNRLYTSESDVYRRQILSYNDGPRTERVNMASTNSKTGISQNGNQSTMLAKTNRRNVNYLPLFAKNLKMTNMSVDEYLAINWGIRRTVCYKLGIIWGTNRRIIGEFCNHLATKGDCFEIVQ